ncbi:MAG: hypothetical protein K6G26_03845 [Lachnospiraceae bacterium]|nr:hypothetical protein [Lachnospiraceae bacterium]
MSNVNLIQSKIMQLEGGAFQKLFDAYLYKKYNFRNIQSLGVQTATNKTTKGTPDTYVLSEDGKYILINYGSVSSQPANKIEADILSCFNKAKLSLNKNKIKKIICGHCSTNIHIEQFNRIIELLEGIEIELIGIDTLSHDLAFRYTHIAKDQLGIEVDTNQFFDIEDFVKIYDANGINAPIDCEFLHRKEEINATIKSICNNVVTVLTGPSGIGKTRLAIEACRAQDNKEYKVFCIRSNGNLLYEDIKFYIDNPGKYMIFFDDANMVVRLDNVLQTLLELSNEYEVRILITVRDYARKSVITTVSKYTKPEVIEIGILTDEEIRDILKKDLGIVNSDFLKKISEIANGNARLAFLAGIRSVDEGYQAIRKAEDIFRNYYGRIIDDAQLTKDDIMMLFFITVAGPVKCGENQLYTDLKKLYGDIIREDEIVEKLYSFELIDWFKNKITKISDQSFGNYILYYVLYEKRWISIENLISIAFPIYRKRAIYILDTLIDIFSSKEVIRYVENAIISAWNNAPKEQNMEYLEAFYQVNPDKALCIIKKKIEQEKYVDFDMHSFDVNSKKNNHIISTKEIEILGGFKYLESFNDSIELLMVYFEKRPDLIMDFYFVICDYLLYDKYSWKNKYKNENELMDKLWEATNEGENYNFGILYIYVAEYVFRTEVSYTEEVRNRRKFNICRMTICYNKEIALLRNKIWRTFGILRKKKEYQEKINDILFEVHFNGLDEKNASAYLQSDFDTIFAEVIKKDAIDFFCARIIDRYKEVAVQINSPIDERYLISENNREFKIYRILSREYLFGTVEEEEKIRKANIAMEFESYSLENYIELFKTCNFLQDTIGEKNLWSLNRGLDIVFELLEINPKFYVDVIEEYFKSNAPFRVNCYRKVTFLLFNIGYEKTYNLLNRVEYRGKDAWLALIWECINEHDITDRVVSDYNVFSKRNLEGDNPIVPSVTLLVRYGERDNGLKNSIIKRIAEKADLSATFLRYAYRDDDIKVILELFKDDYDMLSRIYMNALEKSKYVDYGGKLFIRIFEQRPNIWNEYVDWIKKHLRFDEYEQKRVDLIWSTEKWQECINNAYSVLIEDVSTLYFEQLARLIFGRTEQKSRKQQWLLESLHENCMDVSKCSKLIDVVVNVMPFWKLDYIFEFMKENKNIEDFKKICLFPMSVSWSGSEVPLIIDKLQFLQSLKEKIKGVDYIEHRDYIEECRRKLEEYKRKVELREYIEEADYA